MANQTIPAIQVKDSNVGIGTVTPGAKLVVSGSAVEAHISNGDTNTLTLGNFSGGRHFIKSINLGIALTPLTLQASAFTFDTGNVLIGTTTDIGTKLNVNGTSYISGAASFGSTIDVNGNVTLTQDTNDLIFQQTNSSTHGIVWKNTTYAKDSASIRPTGNGAWATQGIGFYTGSFGNSTSAPLLRFNIQAGGDSIFYNNVGIGTTGPGTQLSIFDSNNSRAYQMSFGYETTETFRLGNNNATGKFTFTQLNNNNGFRFTSTAPNSTGIILDVNTSQFAINGDTGYVGVNTSNPANYLQIGSMGSTGYSGNNLTIGDGTSVFAIYMASNLTNLYTNKAFSFQASGSGATGNVLINTTTDSGYKLNVNGDVYTSSSYTLNAIGDYAARIRTYAPGDGNWGLLTYAADPEYHMVITGASAGASGSNRQFKVQDRPTGNSRFVVNFDGSGVGIGTAGPTRSLHVVGTTRHERVYAYANNVFQFTNDTPQNELWLHLGTQGPFTTDKIYYRVNTQTSEEEGEIIVKNTCVTANIEWLRNSYNVMVTAVKARMQGSCGACEIFIRVRYGSNYGGANTTVQWQVHNGTDSGFTTVNAVATPGTGTNEANIASTDGYMVSTSNNQSVGGNLGVGTTSPSYRAQIETSTGTLASFDNGDGAIWSTLTSAKSIGLSSGTNYAGSSDFTWMKLTGGSSGNMIFTVNNEVMRMLRNGNVLIGTTTDSGNKLRVSGGPAAINVGANGTSLSLSGASGQECFMGFDGSGMYQEVVGPSNATRVLRLQVYNGSSSYAQFFIDGANNYIYPSTNVNFGIGSTAPTVKLRVQSSGSSFTSPDNNNVAAVSIYNSNNSSGNAHAVLSLRTQISGGNPFISFDVENETGWSLGMENSTNQFRLAQGWNSLTSTPVISVPTNGNVLIGTTTDSGYKLDVNGTALVRGNFYTAGELGIELSWTGNTLNDSRQGRIRPISTPAQNPYAGGLAFDYYKFDGSAYNWFEGMRLNGSGSVGIGTTSPNGKLTIDTGPSNIPTLTLNSLVSSQYYGNVNCYDPYHGMILRGIPAAATDYTVTAQDSMSFYEYGSDFRFYKKRSTPTLQLDAQIFEGEGRFRGDVVAYYSFSDERLKDEVNPLENSLDKVLAMQGVSYKWNSGERKGQSDIGLIAQQVEKIVPEVVREKTNIDGDTYKSVNYEHIVGILIEAIKEQQQQIDELKKLIK
jgi:hypothetical protein